MHAPTHASAPGLVDEAAAAQAVVARCRDALLLDGSLLGVERAKWEYDPLSFIKVGRWVG